MNYAAIYGLIGAEFSSWVHHPVSVAIILLCRCLHFQTVQGACSSPPESGRRGMVWPMAGGAAPAPPHNSGYDDFEDPVVRQEDDKEEAELFKDYCMPEEAEEEGTGQEQFLTVLAPQRLRLIGSSRHPGHIVEARTLASVLPPPVTYKLAIWDEMVKEGRAGALSSLQLEAICGACQSHEQMMEDGKHRFGFALGHGTGIGKGESESLEHPFSSNILHVAVSCADSIWVLAPVRLSGRIVAGVVWENFLHGRKKSLWFTASPGNTFNTDFTGALSDLKSVRPVFQF